MQQQVRPAGPRHAAPHPVPAPRRPEPGPPAGYVEPAAGPRPDGGLPGFPAELLPRPARPAGVVGGGLLVGIAGLLGTFALVVGGAVAAGTAPGSPAAAAAAISEWRDGGGSIRVDAIAGDLAAIAEAGADLDPDAMGEACRDLRSDVTAARAFRTIPDGPAQSSWDAALTAGADGARHCIAGTALADPTLLDRAAADLDTMAGHLADVGRALRRA